MARASRLRFNVDCKSFCNKVLRRRRLGRAQRDRFDGDRSFRRAFGDGRFDGARRFRRDVSFRDRPGRRDVGDRAFLLRRIFRNIKDFGRRLRRAARRVAAGARGGDRFVFRILFGVVDFAILFFGGRVVAPVVENAVLTFLQLTVYIATLRAAVPRFRFSIRSFRRERVEIFSIFTEKFLAMRTRRRYNDGNVDAAFGLGTRSRLNVSLDI